MIYLKTTTHFFVFANFNKGIEFTESIKKYEKCWDKVRL